MAKYLTKLPRPTSSDAFRRRRPSNRTRQRTVAQDIERGVPVIDLGRAWDRWCAMIGKE